MGFGLVSPLLCTTGLGFPRSTGEQSYLTWCKAQIRGCPSRMPGSSFTQSGPAGVLADVVGRRCTVHTQRIRVEAEVSEEGFISLQRLLRDALKLF